METLALSFGVQPSKLDAIIHYSVAQAKTDDRQLCPPTSFTTFPPFFSTNQTINNTSSEKLPLKLKPEASQSIWDWGDGVSGASGEEGEEDEEDEEGELGFYE